MKKLSCAEARQIGLVEFLGILGFHPLKTRGTDQWYISPFRKEITPSFKVNQKENIWYDHGRGEGGNLIDFGILFYKCSVSDLLDRLSSYQLNISPSFHLQGKPSKTETGHAGEEKQETPSRIAVVDVRPIKSISLLAYLVKRSIAVETASQFCMEVDFQLYNRKQTAIGFRNDAGGYELRSEHFKGSSSPKAVRFFRNDSNQVRVFEGFFDFLSYQTVNNRPEPPSNFLILNSLVFFHKSREIMEAHQAIQLYLDRDAAGLKITAEACKSNAKYYDESIHYQDSKDLNDWLIKRKLDQTNSAKLDQHRNIQTNHIKRHGRF